MRSLALIVILVLAWCGGGTAGSSAPASAPPAQAKATSNLTAFMGDSITWLRNLSAYDTNPTVNLGVSGQTTVQMLARFNDVLSASPGVVVILGGINEGRSRQPEIKSPARGSPRASAADVSRD